MVYFQRRVGNRAEAEDLTQETFVRLVGSPGFGAADNPSAFVFRVASNLLADRGRDAFKGRQVPFSTFEPALLEQICHDLVEGRQPERVLIGRQSLEEVYECLDELGERTKSIFVLFRLEGMKQKEIAALYNMGLSTVQKHLMRASIHLSQRFDPGAP